MNIAQLDLQQLRIKHILYKSKVRSVLYGGTFDPEFFSHTGPVTFWFNDTGLVKYGQNPEMHELAKINQELNKVALDLIGLYNGGKIDLAHDGLKEIETKSEQFLNLITLLEARLG